MTISPAHDLQSFSEMIGACRTITPIRLALHIPSADKDGQQINHALWIDRTNQIFAHYFGGASISPKQRGFWLNPISRKLICEDTQVVMVYADIEQLMEHIDKISSHIRRFGAETNQGEVMLEVGNHLCLFRNFECFRNLS